MRAKMGRKLRLLRRATDRCKHGTDRRVNICIKAPDRILELLQDSQLHSLDEIKAQSPLPMEEFATILDFFDEFELIELKGEKREAKIKPLGLSFLELPSVCGYNEKVI